MKDFNVVISKVIIGAVLLAAIVVLIGGAVYLLQHGHETISYQVFQGEPKPYTSFFAIWKDAFTLSGRGIIQLGLLLLVVGQFVRVFLTLFLFTEDKDYFFSGASLIILVILFCSILGI